MDQRYEVIFIKLNTIIHCITNTFQCTISTHELSNCFQKETEDHRKYMNMPAAPFQHNLSVCDGDSVHWKSSSFHRKYSYAVDGTTHSRTEKKKQIQFWNHFKNKTLIIFKPLSSRIRDHLDSAWQQLSPRILQSDRHPGAPLSAATYTLASTLKKMKAGKFKMKHTIPGHSCHFWGAGA